MGVRGGGALRRASDRARPIPCGDVLCSGIADDDVINGHRQSSVGHVLVGHLSALLALSGRLAPLHADGVLALVYEALALTEIVGAL